MRPASDRVFDLVLIDFDGTLCATHLAISHCLRATLAFAVGTAPADAAIEAVIARGIGLEDTFHALVPDALARDAALLPDLVRSYRAMYSAEGDARTTLFPGWREALAALAADGVRTAVVSNKGPAAIRAALARFAIADLVTLVVGDTPGVPKKPHPAIVEQVVFPAFSDIPPDRILVVGDTDADIRLAANAGLRSCWARYGYGHSVVCEGLQPDYIIDAPGELPSLTMRAHAH